MHEQNELSLVQEQLTWQKKAELQAHNRSVKSFDRHNQKYEVITMIFFFILSLLCFVYYAMCSRELKRYQNGVSQKRVRLLSYYKSETIAPGSSLRKNRIQWYNLTVELPLESDLGTTETMETTISTTNRMARKYRESEYIDVYIVYKEHSSLIEGVYIKEDLKKSSEKYASLVLESIFLGIFLICLYLSFA